jgi:phosphatidyl-myo-inositol alpha-mannosyltransferase
MYNCRLPEPGCKPGGVDVFVHRVASALVERGHDVKILTYASDAVERPYAVRTIRPASAYHSRTVRRYVAPWLFNARDLSEFEVFHLHGDDWFFLRRRLPTVRTFYGSALFESLTATSAKRRADQAIGFVLELLSARLATGRYGIGTDSRAIYQANGVLACGIEPPTAVPHRSDHPRIAFIGTWAGRKRGSLLHGVFQREILPRIPDAELVMVSDHCEPGPGVTWLQHPSDAEITDLLLSAWAFCLPSTYEGLGLPYLEAMACGTPVVATPNPGAEDLLRPAASGLVVEQENLGSTLVSLLGSEDMRRRLSEAGRARVTDFTWDRVCEGYERAYAKAISDWRDTGPDGGHPPSANGKFSAGAAALR